MILLAVIIFIIIVAVAWGGSKVAQDLVINLVNCNSSNGDGCKEFGDYVASICDSGNYTLECRGKKSSGLDIQGLPPSAKFGWIIDFVPRDDKNLGAYVRMSDKGIGKNSHIIQLSGTIKNSTNSWNFYLDPSDKDKDGNSITDDKKKFIVHDKYVHLYPYGDCSDADCPYGLVQSNGYLALTASKAWVHIRISFKTVPDFINLTINEDDYNYEGFVDTLYRIVKVFDKGAAQTVKDAMTTLSLKVDYSTDSTCPLKPQGSD